MQSQPQEDDWDKYFDDWLEELKKNCGVCGKCANCLEYEWLVLK